MKSSTTADRKAAVRAQELLDRERKAHAETRRQLRVSTKAADARTIERLRAAIVRHRQGVILEDKWLDTELWSVLDDG